MSSVQQKPNKVQAAAPVPSISPSETQTEPNTTKVGKIHDHVQDNGLYESTKLASQSDSLPEITPEPPVAKAGESPVNLNDAEEFTQRVSSLQSGSSPVPKFERPVGKDDGQESTQPASSLLSSSPRIRIEPPAVETKPADDSSYVAESTQLASSLQSVSSSQIIPKERKLV